MVATKQLIVVFTKSMLLELKDNNSVEGDSCLQNEEKLVLSWKIGTKYRATWKFGGSYF
jgi:hypothetical protein